MHNSFRALRHRGYLFVWIGSLLSNIGNWMENVGQGWVVASQTHSAFLVELLSFAQFIPVIFLAIPAGIAADKYNRKKVLIGAQTAMCVIATVLAYLAHKGLATPNVIIIFALLEGVAWAFTGPAWQSVLPYLVPRKDLEPAVALNSIQFNLARLVGPAIAGFVVAHYGFSYAFNLNAISFLAVIGALIFVNFEGKPDAPSLISKDRPSVQTEEDFKSFRDAMRWVKNHPGARRVVLSIALFAIFSAPIQGLMPYFASDILQIGPKGLGNLLSSLGAGAITGAFLLGFLPSFYPKHHLIPLSLISLGLFMITYSQAPTAGFAYVLLFISGIFWIWTMISCNTAMQLLVPDKIRGRAMSILLVANVGMLPIGHLVAGLVANYIGPRTTMLISAICLLIIGLITLVNRVPQIDGITRDIPEPKWRNFYSEIILASQYRADALSLDRSMHNAKIKNQKLDPDH